MNNHPIGILDSGVGGLTVLQAVVSELPRESFIHIGDSENTPYGKKKEEEIYHLSKRLIAFLLKKEVKLIVIACNTITVSCLERLRTDYPDMPIVGTVPVIKTAAAVSKNKRIGILSTTTTAQSDYQKHLIEEFANDCVVFNHGTDALVPLIEQGKVESAEMATALGKVLKPFSNEHIDALALGCTHFPFLKEQIQQMLGHDVQLLDSGGAIARQVKRVLEHNNALNSEGDGNIHIYTTGNMQIAKELAQRILKKDHISVQEVRLRNDN
jgi:glutamate racemase